MRFEDIRFAFGLTLNPSGVNPHGLTRLWEIRFTRFDYEDAASVYVGTQGTFQPHLRVNPLRAPTCVDCRVSHSILKTAKLVSKNRSGT